MISGAAIIEWKVYIGKEIFRATIGLSLPLYSIRLSFGGNLASFFFTKNAIYIKISLKDTPCKFIYKHSVVN